jgi:D-alanyl-D-alanine carboxypeptidase/D-alanyl-D-alanine-endopeptidase (penicillin-binding protein 4)
MMYVSDNFLAEQLLLMASYQAFGFFSCNNIIDSIIKTECKKNPSIPVWVDGSGLSRYNLFTPDDFVFILDKLNNEFGKSRIRSILSSGGHGTLKNYFVSDSTNIYAKTGTLSHVVTLSGYMTTKKGNELIFSVLVNNSTASSRYVRKAVEKFIKKVRSSY